MVSMNCLRFLHEVLGIIAVFGAFISALSSFDRSLVWPIAGAVTLDGLGFLAVVYILLVSSASRFVDRHCTLAWGCPQCILTYSLPVSPIFMQCDLLERNFCTGLNECLCNAQLTASARSLICKVNTQ